MNLLLQKAHRRYPYVMTKRVQLWRANAAKSMVEGRPRDQNKKMGERYQLSLSMIALLCANLEQHLNREAGNFCIMDGQESLARKLRMGRDIGYLNGWSRSVSDVRHVLNPEGIL